MESDRELLELAAKAFGLNNAQYFYRKPSPALGWPAAEYMRYYDDDEKCQKSWSPLQDAGACARMEAQLRIDVDWFKDKLTCYAWDIEHEEILAACEEFYADHGNDSQRARMMASTRAAAAIGRSMP
jgi:hypothetical protein